MKPFLTIRDMAFTFAPPKINWRFHLPFKIRTPSFNKKCVTPFFKCRTPNFKCVTPSLKCVTPMNGTVSIRRLVNSLKLRYLGVLFKGLTSSGIFSCTRNLLLFHHIKIKVSLIKNVSHIMRVIKTQQLKYISLLYYYYWFIFINIS